MSDSTSDSQNATCCVFGCFAPLVLIVAGLMAWMLIGEPRQQSAGAQEWVATPCTVTSSQIRTNRSGASGGGGRTNRRGSGGTWTSWISIHYTYVWNGETLSGNVYSFSPTSDYSAAEMQKIVNSLPPGTHTTCYVNPKRPLESVLNRDTPSASKSALLPLGVVFIFFGMGFALWRFKARSA